MKGLKHTPRPLTEIGFLAQVKNKKQGKNGQDPRYEILMQLDQTLLFEFLSKMV